MKYFTLFAGAASAALVTRDLATVQSALQSISQATMQLQSGIQGFNGAGQVQSLTSASQNVISTTKQATSDVQGSSDLSSTDALKLPGPVQSLGSLVTDTVNALIAKKPTFASLGVCSVVEDQSMQISSAAQAFSTTLLSKIPQELQTIGQNLAAPITQALQKAVNAFQSCPSSGSSSMGGSSSSMSMSMSSSMSSSAPATTSSGSAPGYSSGMMTTSSAPASSAPASSSLPVETSSAPAATSSGVAPPSYTGAASHNAAGFGAAAVAAVAVLAF